MKRAKTKHETEKVYPSPLYNTKKSILSQSFYPLTNQLGKFLENFRNFFVSLIGRQRERPKLNTIFKKISLTLIPHKKYAFGPNFFITQLVGIEKAVLFGFVSKNF